jgi:PAS domain S-box-containing protein
MSQAAQGGLWPESHVAGHSNAGAWSIERQDAPVEDYLRFFPGQAGGRVYEQLLFNLPMNLQCMDGAGRISSVNKQWMDTLGYTLADVNGRHWHELLDQDSRQRLTRDIYPRYLQSAVIRQVEIVMHRKDGSPARMLMSAHGYRGSKGRIERSIVILHEVTARRSAETALQRSEQRFRGAFDAAAHGIVLVAPNGRMLAYNPAFKEMSGRSDEELSNFAFDESIHDDDKANFLAAMRRLIDGEIPSLKMEVRYVGGDKPVMSGFTSVSLVRNEDQGIDHLVVQIVDTTSRRRAELRLQQAQRMEAVGQITGRLAHDFNNVLTVVIGNLDLIELALKNDQKALSRVKEAIEAAHEGSELTRQLLSFSRQQVLEPKVVSVNQLVKKIEPLISHTLGETIELKISLMETDANISVDAAQFETCLINLAIDARDAMPSGGRYVVETRSAAHDPHFASDKPQAESGNFILIVASNSGGATVSEQPDRAGQSIKQQASSLAMVNGFATQSGGYLQVESEPGRGTTVRMYLPRQEPAESSTEKAPAWKEAAEVHVASPAIFEPRTVDEITAQNAADGVVESAAENAVAAPVQAASKRKAKILVVEDQEGVREVAAGFLTEFGYDVIEAEDGIAALSLLQEHKDIDLMFTDVVMPGGLNGFDVAQAAQQIIPDLVIVHTSGYPKGAMIHSEEPRLKDNIIMKPYRREELERAINEAFARKAPAR